MKYLYNIIFTLAAGTTLFAAPAQAEKWDMPMAYAASNFHSEMGAVFAQRVRDYTDGEIDITVHPGGSLFKGGEIKRAVQTGQAPIGERFMSAHANEAPLLGWDNLPFLATTYEDNDKLWIAAKDKVNMQLLSLNLIALYTCPWPGQGFYFKKAVNSSADTQGIKFRSYNSATATFAKELGMTPVQVEAAAHSDFGVLTILMQDNLGGLQVQNKAGKWIEAPPIPGTLVCNIGDLLERWTNGVLVSTKHRVLNRSSNSRFSIPVFCDPASDAVVDPRDFDPDADITTYPPVTAGDYIVAKNQRNFAQYKK